MTSVARCSFLACLVLLAAGPAAQQAPVEDRIAAAVRAIRLVDTHEHLSAEAVRLKKEPSLFSLLHYVSSDMWADGMDRAAGERTLGNASIPLARQWELVAPYWANVRTTAYGRSLLRAIRDLYGVGDISESTYAEISRKVREASRPGWYEYVLKKRAGIDEAIETLPADKILAFGGDYNEPEGSYAHAMLCREVVARVLSAKVKAGYWTEAEAVAFARAVLRDNANRTFKLGLAAGERGGRRPPPSL
jgi:hypothetical protein